MHLYLHIPFCHRICPYCSFYKHTPGKTDIARFIHALATEAGRQGDLLENITTIYIGGGTPSMLSPKHLKLLFSLLAEKIDLSQCHITFEANPATFDESKARLFKDLGVNRISLGIQSFTPHVLQTLGREHNPQEAIESVRTLQQCGMEEINIDLMFSIPRQTLTDWQQTLDQAIALNPQHISAYNLTYEEDTDFLTRFQTGEYQQTDDDNAEHFLAAQRSLTAAGFLHYETSNYAQPGYQSRHNIAYWHGADYLGLGPSAVSTINGQRWKNLPDTARYIHAIDAIGHAKREEEIIDPAAYRIERIALLLRTTEGLPLEYLTDTDPTAIAHLVEENLAETTPTHLRLTGNGPMLVDPIAERLI